MQVFLLLCVCCHLFDEVTLVFVKSPKSLVASYRFLTFPEYGMGTKRNNSIGDRRTGTCYDVRSRVNYFETDWRHFMHMLTIYSIPCKESIIVILAAKTKYPEVNVQSKINMAAKTGNANISGCDR